MHITEKKPLQNSSALFFDIYIHLYKQSLLTSEMANNKLLILSNSICLLLVVLLSEITESAPNQYYYPNYYPNEQFYQKPPVGKNKI